MEIINRNGREYIRLPTTAREWAQAAAWVVRHTVTSARLPHPSPRRHRARVTLLMAGAVSTIVAGVVFAAFRLL